ncbi:MAG: primary replicative helicase [Gemmatimonadetes bacterium]|nr:primary replicative helicase [Gemmatimonadota bacterium]
MPDFTPIGALLGGLLGTQETAAADARLPVTPVDAGAVDTGLPPLDALTGGWRPGELVLVTGGPGAGKSALLYGQALHAARGTAAAVALAPLKHTARVSLWRLACALADVEIGRVMRAALDREERGRMTEATARLGALPLHLLVSVDATVEDVAEKARRLHRSRGLRLLAVDGLHALGMAEEETEPVTRERRLLSVTAALAELGRELAVPVLASVSPEADAERLAPLARRLLRIGPADPRTGNATLHLRGAPGEERVAEVRFVAERLRFEDAAE